jgi:hypothetical protein
MSELRTNRIVPRDGLPAGAAVESFRNETVKVSQLLMSPPKQINMVEGIE